jgi:diadenylate cyclase
MNFLHWFREISFVVCLDILFMWLLIYCFLVWFKQRRAGFVLTGIVIVAAIYLASRQFGLQMTAAVFEGFFTVILIALIVIFQEELRHFFEQVAVWSLNSRLKRGRKIELRSEEVEILVRTLGDLSREKIGALIVFPGKDLIVRHLDGGFDLNGKFSEPLLKSLFDPHSIGHDGAVIIRGREVVQFGCHLPLSKNLKKIGKRGTRHTAALGLSELTDALCLVVSEERGTISIARNGDIEEIQNLEKLTLHLERFFKELRPDKKTNIFQDFWQRNWREKLIAIIISAGLWFVLIYNATLTYKTFKIPVMTGKLPHPWVVEKIDPAEIAVTFRGPRSAFFAFSKDKVNLFPKFKMEAGSQKVKIHTNDLAFPKNIYFEDFDIEQIHVVIGKMPEKKKENIAGGLIEIIAEKSKELMPNEETKGKS